MFFNFKESFNIPIKDGELYYISEFIKKEKSKEYFKILKNEIEWQQDEIKIFGKVYLQPRLTALYASNDNTYKYSNITMHPKKFSHPLLILKEKIEKEIGTEFTTCLLNFYRNGQDSNGWHSDNEKELGKNPIIASLSFGADRIFQMKHRVDKSDKLKINLENGSLLVMQGGTQHHWLHQIPKTKKDVGERINLTFRIIK